MVLGSRMNASSNLPFEGRRAIRRPLYRFIVIGAGGEVPPVIFAHLPSVDLAPLHRCIVIDEHAGIFRTSTSLSA
jgi:hypothetical protein